MITRRLNEEIQNKFGTQKALAQAIGAKDGSYIAAYTSGRSIIGNVMQKKFRDAGLDVDYILYGSGKSSTTSMDYEQCSAQLVNMQAKLAELMKDMAEMSKMMRNLQNAQDKSDDNT